MEYDPIVYNNYYPITNLIMMARQRRLVRETPENTFSTAHCTGGGAEGDNNSNDPSTISADGRSVAFSSDAANPVSEDANKRTGVFVAPCR